jgi:hypothetical protein
MDEAKEEDVVAGIPLSKTSPTRLTYDELYTWVIWQFPRQKNGGLCGAVRPPLQQHGWIPAVILVPKKSVEVYAHLNQSYPTPEAAAEHFNSNHS